MLPTEYVVAQDFWLLNNINTLYLQEGLHVFKVQCEVLASVLYFNFYCLKIKVKKCLLPETQYGVMNVSFTYSKF